MTKPHFNKISILGIGLIGASFALALKKNLLCPHIAGYGRKRDNLGRAKELGIIDSFAANPGEVCRDADLVMLATPVGSFSGLIGEISPYLKKGAIVTDAGSVKGKLVYEMEKMMPEGVYYVGAHPIAGSDRSGIDASHADLFLNARCIVTPTSHSGADALKKVASLWQAIGSKVIEMDPDKHDRIYAAVSHLPHLIAYALVNTVAEIDGEALGFSGQGFMDTTRIASSSHELWRDICLMNRENLIEMIALFQKNINILDSHLKASDSVSLEREFLKARTVRQGIGQD
ncbi:MAG: prephenate dehydrogenase/arogenate dehydrogenase family protein [Nitrospirae bacterium]|nr:prephenate dehydrogenase/arogenate dehydrogenase family protein [Nitrospirota bacterium]